MSILSKLLADTGFLERRRKARVRAGDVEVSYRSETGLTRAKIKDISEVGVYILTEERWPPGTEVRLTLESKSASSGHAYPDVQLDARVVRQGEDGVGLTFVRSEIEANVWLGATAIAGAWTAPRDMVGKFRLAKAITVLSRISPSIEIEVAAMMAGGLSQETRERIIDISLWIEERLHGQNQPTRNNVPASLILQLLEGASKAEDVNAQSYWVELLASSCATGASDEESLKCTEVLSKMASVHLAIFAAACRKATQKGGARGLINSSGCYCNADEIRNIARMENLVAIEHHLYHLYDLGLLEETVKPLHGEQIERANLTPTSFGLRLHARCNRSMERLDFSGHPELEFAS